VDVLSGRDTADTVFTGPSAFTTLTVTTQCVFLVHKISSILGKQA